MKACIRDSVLLVAPFTGAWIEIYKEFYRSIFPIGSHPSRVRGLKFSSLGLVLDSAQVAPFTGAWIEIP